MRFSESPGQIVDNSFVFIEYVQWKDIFSNNTMVRVPYVKPVPDSITVAYAVNESDKFQLNRHVREFKLENNYLLWSKFLRKKCLQYFFGGILFLMIAGKIAKNHRTRQNFVPHGITFSKAYSPYDQ